jgi:hypothetical protein
LSEPQSEDCGEPEPAENFDRFLPGAALIYPTFLGLQSTGTVLA